MQHVKMVFCFQLNGFANVFLCCSHSMLRNLCVGPEASRKALQQVDMRMIWTGVVECQPGIITQSNSLVNVRCECDKGLFPCLIHTKQTRSAGFALFWFHFVSMPHLRGTPPCTHCKAWASGGNYGGRADVGQDIILEAIPLHQCSALQCVCRQRCATHVALRQMACAPAVSRTWTRLRPQRQCLQ